VQYRPGVFNEHALRSLDYVIFQAGVQNIRVLIPFVNSWDDYGGMNQYVRWRSQIPVPGNEIGSPRFSIKDIQRVVAGAGNRSYQYAVTTSFGHDDFYSDSIIKSWYKNYITRILSRVNTYTGRRYKDEPNIFGWELANEPRSSDRSARLIYDWVNEMSSFIKSIDGNHLIGTGEEGFDTSVRWYSRNSYNNQDWLFDGTAGVSFSLNSSAGNIDFSSCHLYPEAWNISDNAGNTWIREHTAAARSMRKPLLLGEFGVRQQKRPVYESWATTTLLDGTAGLIVWQILEGSRIDNEGFGFRCPQEQDVCDVLQTFGIRFQRKTEIGGLPQPAGFSLSPNYPNPFNGITTIAYALPVEARVNLTVFNVAGQQVATLVDAVQGTGERKELFEADELASGAYFYRLTVEGLAPSHQRYYIETRKLLLLR
ncbi:MAG: cellulase family glycosylhydrolase, partial [bacterium]